MEVITRKKELCGRPGPVTKKKSIKTEDPTCSIAEAVLRKIRLASGN